MNVFSEEDGNGEEELQAGRSRLEADEATAETGGEARVEIRVEIRVEALLRPAFRSQARVCFLSWRRCISRS